MVDTAPRYAQADVARILARAAELQREELEAGDSKTRMSLAEVEAAAGEAGIERALVRRAATELAPRRVERSPSSRLWWGGEAECVVERTLVGEYPIEDFDRLVEVIGAHGFDGGQVTTLGRSLTWSSVHPQNADVQPTTVTITVRDGRTRIAVRGNFRPLVGAVYGGVGGGVGGSLVWLAVMGGAATAGSFGAVGGGLLFAGAVYGLCRAIYGRASRKRAERLRALTEALEAEVAGLVV